MAFVRSTTLDLASASDPTSLVAAVSAFVRGLFEDLFDQLQD